MRVLLPAPFSPRSAWISPVRRSKSTWSLARTPGKTLTMPTASSAGTPAPDAAGAGLAPSGRSGWGGGAAVIATPLVGDPAAGGARGRDQALPTARGRAG